MAQTMLVFDEFEPLPGKSRHYVPVVQNKRGEREALAQLTNAAWSRLTPIFCFVGDKKPEPPLSDGRVLAWARHAEETFANHVFYADFVRQDPSMPVTDKRSTWTLAGRAYERLRKRDLQFVPVFRDNWPLAVAHHVASAHDADGRGAALRIRLDNTITSSVPLATRLARAANRLDIPPAFLDLIVDLGYLDCESDPDLDGVADSVAIALSAAAWRNVIVCATSMPSAMSKGIVPGGTVGSLPRHERSIYARARAAVDPKPVTYGDYLVQNPDPPLDRSGPGFRPNIRYTTADETLIARGERPYTEVGNQDYPNLCEKLARHRAFAGATFSWGDRLLAQCARGAVAPGGQAMWRGVGSSHHIAQVLVELS